jgi:hypothetical protein
MRIYFFIICLYICTCLDYLKSKNIKLRPKSDIVRLVEIDSIENIKSSFKDYIILFHPEHCLNW